MVARFILPALCALCLLSACAAPQASPQEGPGFVNGKPIAPTVKLGKPYSVNGRTYVPKYEPDFHEEGEASWYGPGFHGKQTANGERFDAYALTAAHKTLPLPSVVRVTNLNNGRSVVVRVNDRGPFAEDRVIDLSKQAAQEIDMIRTGTARVKVEYLEEETKTYLAQLTGRDIDTLRGWNPAPTPPVMANAAPANDVNALAAHTYTPPPEEKGSWFSSLFVSDAQAGIPPAQRTHKAAEVPSIAAADLTPLPPKPAIENQGDSHSGYRLPPASLPAPSASFSPPPAGGGGIAESIASKNTILASSAGSSVQLGAFSSRANAELLGARYRHLAPVNVQGVPADAPQIYRVRLGPFADTYEAESVLSKVREGGIPDAQIVR